MRLYLGNHQESVLDAENDDIIQLSPIAYAIGGVYKDAARKAYRAQFWDNDKFKFTYNRSYLSDNNKSADATKAAAKKYYDEHNILHKGIVINVK